MTAAGPPEGWRAKARVDLRVALGGWVVARVVVIAALVVAHLVSNAIDPEVLHRGPRLAQGLLAWDGDWYQDIARHGYAALDPEGLRFFPLYPFAARILALPLFGRVGLAQLVLANGAALVLGALVHRLVLEEKSDPALARRAAWLVALVPPFFVMAMGYSEPIALCLAVSVFLALRRRRWGWAAAAGFLAGLTRPVGSLLAIPAAIEGARGWSEAPSGERLRRLAPVAAPLAGSGCFLVWVWVRFGDPLLPLSVQSSPGLRGGLAFPPVVLWQAFADPDTSEAITRTNVSHVPWLIALIALAVVVWRRWPPSYAAFTVATLVLAASTEYWGSLERYGFGAFPVVLALASLTGRRPRAARAVMVTSAALMGTYATLGFLDLYVP